MPHLQTSPIVSNQPQLMTRPEPLLSFSDYAEDFKARVQIHNYEVKKLTEDFTLLFNALTDKAYYIATDR